MDTKKRTKDVPGRKQHVQSQVREEEKEIWRTVGGLVWIDHCRVKERW